MAKPCPVNPTHQTKEIPMGSSSFTLCSHPDCKEDVDHLAKQMGKTWSEEDANWVEMDLVADETEEEFDEFDDDDDLAPIGPPQITPQMRPTLDLGQGTHQMVLISTDDVEASYVTQVLEQALNKNPVSANYLVKDAHFKGRTVVKYGSQQELQNLMNQVDLVKQNIALSGRVFANTVLQLQLVIEQTTP